MRQKMFLILLWMLTAVTLSACLPVIQEVVASTPIGTLSLQPIDTVQPATIEPINSDEPVTAVPHTVTPPANTAVPTSAQPILITTDITNVRVGPGTNFDVSHVLTPNTIVPILGKNLDSTWWAVPGPGDGPGPGGWMSNTVVVVQGDTSSVPFLAPPTLTPTPALPLIEYSDLPPSNRCVASRPGQFPPPDIFLGPGRHFALVARLGNWAEVLSSEIGWHQILIGPGQVGWVDGADVDLTGPCPTTVPVPQHIQFEPGAISANVAGELQPPQRDMYLFRALAGQRTTIEIQSTDDRANFMLNGVNDGQPYKRLEDEQRSWSAQLPLEQDYLLTVAAPANAPATTYSVALIIEPLSSVPPPTGGMMIESFTVTAIALPDNGKQLTFQWTTRGGTSARILSGSAQRFQPVWDVPLSGETTVDLAQTLFQNPDMILELQDAEGNMIHKVITVEWDCTNIYFFTPAPRRCPHPMVATVNAVIQTFENGRMLWLENIDGDGRRDIIVLYDDGTLQPFTDIWQEGDPVDDPTLESPVGLFQPVRGFGKVWREQPGVRERLGWAINLEQAFQAVVQKEMVESLPSMGYLELPDGRILHLTLDTTPGSWEQIN